MEEPAIINNLISWIPMLILIGVWLIFMRKFRTTTDPNVEILEEMRRQREILERIEKAIEK